MQSNSKLGHKIKGAFPSIFTQPRLPHEGCVWFRSRLIMVDSNGFESTLAEVLLDLLETHTCHEINSDWAEDVIYFLDVDEKFNGLAVSHEGQIEVEENDDKVIRNGKIDSLKNITKQQAKIIKEWLEEAKTWPDLAWYQENIDSAIRYWEKRSS